MHALSPVPDSHRITPLAGSVRRVRDGELADLLRPSDYPVTAICKACGQPIRTERWLLSEWRHIALEH